MTEERLTNWSQRAKGGYEKLGWVSANNLLDHLADISELQGHEVVVDVGTGTQAVLNTMATRLTKGGLTIGFDLSADMLARKNEPQQKNIVFLADAKNIPLPDSVADVVTARMVLHHIADDSLPRVISEMGRITKSNGKIIICEYVARDEEVWQFERQVFDIKEPERHLWTGPQLKILVESHVETSQPTFDGRLSYAVMPQYSVKDWMGKSGLPRVKQEAVLERYLQAPAEIVQKMGISYTEDNDALVDRLFAYVLASPNHKQ